MWTPEHEATQPKACGCLMRPRKRLLTLVKGCAGATESRRRCLPERWVCTTTHHGVTHVPPPFGARISYHAPARHYSRCPCLAFGPIPLQVCAEARCGAPTALYGGVHASLAACGTFCSPRLVQPYHDHTAEKHCTRRTACTGQGRDSRVVLPAVSAQGNTALGHVRRWISSRSAL